MHCTTKKGNDEDFFSCLGIKLRIGGLDKLTLMDYPSHVACIVFTQGCNFNCAFCHNSDLISAEQAHCIMPNDVLSYLKFRKNILDGVVVSGGEPLIQHDLCDFLSEVKAIGLKVKLDTNASDLFHLKELLDLQLLDYVAIDIKADADNYTKIIGVEQYSFENINKAVEIILNSRVNHEFRTTIMKEFHDYAALENICKCIGNESKYFLQNFEHSECVIGKNLTGFDKNELKNIESTLKIKYPKIMIRGA